MLGFDWRRVASGGEMRGIDLESLPVGFRFHPTDEEVINHYLKKKILGKDSEVWVIPVVDILKSEPWELPEFSVIQSDDQEWYFFCSREGKNRANRATKAGFWKPTGTDRKIKSRGTTNVIGTKKTLVFHKGRAPTAVRTNWVIHEYHVPTTTAQKAFVLCLLKRKPDENSCDEVEPLPAVALNNSRHTSENGVAEETTLGWDPEILAQLNGFSEPTYQSPELQSQMYPEQGPSSMDFQFSNGFNNNYEGMQFSFDPEEDEDWRSFLVNEDEWSWAESSAQKHLAVKRSENKRNDMPPESHVIRLESTCPLRRDFVRYSDSSSETDTELPQPREDPILKTFRTLNRHVGISPSEHIRTLPSSNRRQNERENIGFLHDESGGSSASSVDSATDRHFEINSNQLFSPEFPVNIRSCRAQYQPQSHKFVAQKTAPGRICSQKILHKEEYQGNVRESSSSTEKLVTKPDSVEAKDVAEHGTATNLPQKENSVVVSDNDLGLGMAQGGYEKQSLKSRLHGSTGSNQKGSFIFLETPLVSHRSSSPSVYVVNVLLGIFLFAVFAGEVVHWC